MKLTELQKQITPLPWKACESEGMHGIDCNGQLPVIAHIVDQYRGEHLHNKAYIAHCANHFPALVEALKQCFPVMVRSACGDSGVNHQQAAQDCSELIRKALATAETVKEL